MANTQPRGAPGAGGFCSLSFKTGPKGRFLNGLCFGPRCSVLLCGNIIFFDCHAIVRPFAFLSRSKGPLSRFASPARGHFLLRQKVTKERPGVPPGPGGPAKGSGLGRLTQGPPDLTHGAGSIADSTLIYYQRFPTDGARRLDCAGILDLCSRLPASGLSRPEARWPDKVLFSAEKSGAASRQWPAGRGWGGGQRFRPWADDPRGRLISPTVWRSMEGSTLIYYQRVPTDGARRLGCAGILVLCCRLPASGL